MKCLFPSAFVILCLALPTQAQKTIKVNPDAGVRAPGLMQPSQPQIRPAPTRPGPTPEGPDLSDLSLAETYRALDIFKYTGRGVTRGAALDALLRAFQAEQFDDDPALTIEDYRLRAALDLARRRANLASRLMPYDLDGDLVATESELRIGARSIVSKSRQPVAYTEAQIEQLVLEKLATFLTYDADGDRNVTLAELHAWAEAESDAGVPTSPAALSLEWDVNADGEITEVELRRAADAALDLIDLDRDGLLAQQEIEIVRKALHRRKQRADNKTRGGKVPCNLPQLPPAIEIVVVQARQGSGVTNLDFEGDRSAVVRMSELVIPERERPVHIIASMRTSTVFHITGEGAARVRGVTGVAAPVGVISATAMPVDQTRCFSGFLGIRVQEPGGIRSEFERALGRRVQVLVEAETLGQVDVARGRNNVTTRLEGDILATLKGDAATVGAWLLQYDPGGYQEPPPNQVAAATPVTSLPVPPLEVGLMHLAMEGALDFAEGPTGRPVARIRTDNAEAGKPSSKSGTAPGAARPAQNFLHVIARRFFKMPPGFGDEGRAVRVLVPDGVPVPQGIPAWNKTR